ncbi:chaperone NapD [Thalassoglobus sp.]|uniref:chaperone NapD n=1 Tax=Thalassoglobus sp. TaxID=2795869 RepID=UPI003AA7AB5A
MIASVVVTLEDREGPVQDVVDEIRKLSNVEIGEFGSDATRIPVMIDSPVPDALEETTRRIQGCFGVAFVDVVFVHFEDDREQNSVASPKEANES